MRRLTPVSPNTDDDDVDKHDGDVHDDISHHCSVIYILNNLDFSFNQLQQLCYTIFVLRFSINIMLFQKCADVHSSF